VDGVASYRCDCTDGYAGENCSEDVDECASSPCQNEADCMDSVSSSVMAAGVYVCQCISGYSGWNCETDIDDCGARPCGEPPAVCTDLVDDYLCSAPIEIDLELSEVDPAVRASSARPPSTPITWQENHHDMRALTHTIDHWSVRANNNAWPGRNLELCCVGGSRGYCARGGEWHDIGAPRNRSY
jgi:hypothetical protein